MFLTILASQAAEKSPSNIANIIVPILIVAFFAGLTVIIIRRRMHARHVAAEQQKATQQILGRHDVQAIHTFKLISGLPLVIGSLCYVMLTPQGYVFEYENKTYQLAFEKVYDVVLQEFRQEYLQPYGLDSPNRIQSQWIRNISYSLNFLYKDGESINQIVFDCPSKIQAASFISAFRNRPREQETVNL